MGIYGKLTWDQRPSAKNPRNSEGAFARLPDGSILFAYSRYCGDDWEDAAACEIAGIISKDNGDTWGEPFCIVSPKEYGVHNVMSVSMLELKDGSIGVVHSIKELDGRTTVAMSVTRDGREYTHRRCQCNFRSGYYVMNNDRVERLRDGRIILPVSFFASSDGGNGNPGRLEYRGIGYYLVSTDEMQSLTMLPPQFTQTEPYSTTGIQEPGLLERQDGVLWSYGRTDRGWQYECFSFDGLKTVTPSQQSRFSSPISPMKIKRNPYTGDLVAVWNPIPVYNGRKGPFSGYGFGRTPFAIARSTDDGKTWGELVLLEDDEERGYCYPAIFFVDEKTLLVGYCRGGVEDGSCLIALGIQKLTIDF